MPDEQSPLRGPASSTPSEPFVEAGTVAGQYPDNPLPDSVKAGAIEPRNLTDDTAQPGPGEDPVDPNKEPSATLGEYPSFRDRNHSMVSAGRIVYVSLDGFKTDDVVPMLVVEAHRADVVTGFVFTATGRAPELMRNVPHHSSSRAIEGAAAWAWPNF